jgi:pimeloyl-ACP methyl ester carboxylesterase
MDTPDARAAFPPMGRLMWWIAARSARLMGLFLNLTKPRGLNDPAKVRKQMLPRMQPVERAVFDKPGRLEAFMASGMESMRQGVKGIAWDTHLYARPWDFRLEEICFPVRLLHGEADQNVPVAIARRMAATIPGCRATFYPGEGHISTAINHLGEVVVTLAAAVP